MLKWCGHEKRIREERLDKRVHRAIGVSKRGRRRPQRKWRDEMKDLLMKRGLSEREEVVLARDKDIKDIRHLQMIGTSCVVQKIYIYIYMCVGGGVGVGVIVWW